MRVFYFLLKLGLALSVPLNYESDCGVCEKDVCPPLSCENGTIKDKCGCCEVCLRKDGETCGGILNMYGMCGPGLFCSMRHLMPEKHMILPDQHNAGKCEPDVCKETKCLRHQLCTEKEGSPLCYCPSKCDRLDKEPLCGANGQQYRNHCELMREKCETQTNIEFFPGECLECTNSDGTKHPEGTKLPTENLCEFRECRGGAFITYFDKNCVTDKGCCTKMFANCPIGQFCLLPKDESRLGNCTTLDPDLCYYDNRVFKAKQSFIDTDCTGYCRCIGYNQISCVSLCPPTAVGCGPRQTIVTVKEERSIEPRCYCDVPRCIDNDVICNREPYPGHCYAYHKRWYHDRKDGKCKHFTYGGCESNGNNFKTRELCENACMKKDTIFVVYPPKVKRDVAKSFVWPSGRSQKVQLSTTKMAIYGIVHFDKQIVLPQPSCLFISLREAGRKDVSSFLLETVKIDLSYHDTNNSVPYQMDTMKPIAEELSQTYKIQARLHVGWCPKQEESVRKGDYLTQRSFRLHLTEKDNLYIKDITLNCYKCKTRIKRDNPLFLANFETINNQSTPAGKPELPIYQFIKEGFGEYYSGRREGPKLSDKKMLIKGNIKLPHIHNGRLPNKSCLRISFEDISIADASSVTLSSKTIDVSNMRIGSHYNFELESRKPVESELRLTYSVDAVLNYGWCPNESDDSFIRLGDYLTDTAHLIALEKEVDEYVMDVQMICYTCPEDRGVKDAEEKKSLVTSEMPPVNIDYATEHSIPIIDKELNVEDGSETLLSSAMRDAGNSEITGEGFPFPAQSTPPKLATKTISIHGHIKFPNKVGILPKPSCMFIKLGDVSAQDAAENVISSTKKEVSELSVDQEIAYHIESLKPEDFELWRTFAISATINSGWCPSNVTGSEWLRHGDYTVDTIHQVNLNNETDIYEQDINVIQYSDHKLTTTAYAHDNGAVVINAIDKRPQPTPESDQEKLTTCMEGNRTYKHGSSWNESACTLCKCEHGKKMCITTDCIPCIKTVIEPGICCPKCLDDGVITDVTSIISTIEPKTNLKTCFDNVLNEEFTVGKTWNRDDCTPCMCDESSNEPVCYIIDCVYTLIKPCKNLIYTPGKCCPDCGDETSTCFDDITKKTYTEGETWLQNMCQTCKCTNGAIKCRTECPEPIRDEPKPCFDNNSNETVQDGKSWKRDPCTTCKCSDGNVVCAAHDCFPLPCSNPITQPGKCCPECPKEECIDRSTNKTRNEGESWIEKDGCTHCQCSGGTPICASPMCMLPQCDDGEKAITIQGICCPVCSNDKICTDEITQGKYPQGQRWQDNTCKVCKCTSDGIVCEEPNTNIEGCSSVVLMNKSCAEICLDKPNIDELDP